MARKKLSLLFLVIFTLLMGSHVLAESEDVPSPVGDIYVQDFSDVLSEAEKSELNTIGRKLEDSTTAQVSVLIVHTTGEKTIEQYALEAFREYGIGNEESNNGVLLVLALDDKKVRIEVGYGLEGQIPDGKAGSILDEYAIPFLQKQESNLAVTETYKVLVNEVYAEYGLENQQIEANKVEASSEFPMWIIIVIVVVVLFLDIKFLGGAFSYTILSILARGGGRGGGNGGPRGGGGGSAGGGGASRGW